MTSTSKIALVTGGNKGIGFAIVKGLCERFDGIVYLTARDVGRGKEAIGKLVELGLKPAFHQLDINNQNSINNFKQYLTDNYGGIDLLVNNAAIFSNLESFPEHANETVSVNYFSLLNVCDALFPLLRKNARVVNLSSSAGHLSRIPSSDIQRKFTDVQLTIPRLNELMNEFVSNAKEGTHVEKGWGTSAYVVSKVGVSALTILQQKMFDNEECCRNIHVNSVHPGFVDTDMTKHKGVLTTEEGAKAPLFLALDPHELKGQFVWFDSSVVDWYGPTVPK